MSETLNDQPGQATESSRRPTHPNLLMGIGEIQDRLNCTRKWTVHLLNFHPAFPQPVAHLHSGRVWLTVEVEEWISKHRPGKARPAPSATTSAQT